MNYTLIISVLYRHQRFSGSLQNLVIVTIQSGIGIEYCEH